MMLDPNAEDDRLIRVIRRLLAEEDQWLSPLWRAVPTGRASLLVPDLSPLQELGDAHTHLTCPRDQVLAVLEPYRRELAMEAVDEPLQLPHGGERLLEIIRRSFLHGLPPLVAINRLAEQRYDVGVPGPRDASVAR